MTCSRTTVRPGWPRLGLGCQPQLEHQARSARGEAAGGVWRGHRELHERRAGGRRHSSPTSEISRRPILGEALPVLGIVAFMDFNWSDNWTSTAGYSMRRHPNSDGQADGRVSTKANMRWQTSSITRWTNVMLGVENCSGASAKTSRRVHLRTTFASSSR